jgi:hypothetical protein
MTLKEQYVTIESRSQSELLFVVIYSASTIWSPSEGKLYFKDYLRESFHIRFVGDATDFILF